MLRGGTVMHALADGAVASILIVVAPSACHPVDLDRAFGAPCGHGIACRSPYVCGLDTCRVECRTDSDCSGGACISLETAQWVCTNTWEQNCKANSDDACPYGTECGVDGVCRNECDAHHPCSKNRYCTSGTCFTNREPLEAGIATSARVDASLP
ncbi:MAG TPA: hypothetical protein VHU80_07030 [Polyangiaceae bacterium]|nr:hypothetical protein [Polyangiaceae bacterium]